MRRTATDLAMAPEKPAPMARYLARELAMVTHPAQDLDLGTAKGWAITAGPTLASRYSSVR